MTGHTASEPWREVLDFWFPVRIGVEVGTPKNSATT
jgi:hypothetical protein